MAPDFIVANPPRSSLWRFTCMTPGCQAWGRKRVSYADAEQEAIEHCRAKHPKTDVVTEIWLQFEQPTPEQKGETMRKRKDIEAEAKMLERRLSSLVAELEEIDSLPEEPGGDGTVVLFGVRFHPGDRTYDYAAYRAVDSWWLTGREKGGRSWEELLEFMSQDHRIADEGAPIIFEVLHAGKGKVVTQEVKR